MHWGYSATFDSSSCELDKITDRDHIIAFTKELVKRIDMVAFGNPIVERFGDGNKMGYSMVQLIQTSCITAHFCEETCDLYLDVFSCKHFDMNTVKLCIEEYFDCCRTKMKMVERQA